MVLRLPTCHVEGLHHILLPTMCFLLHEEFHFMQIGLLKPDKTIPDVILRQAKGLAIITVAKVGVMVTYNIGTGIVVARREDGSWSPPSAVSTFGMGWGAQVK